MNHEVTFYTRANCPLCEKAYAAVREAIALHQLPVRVTVTNIDTDAALRARLTDDVPVIYVDGVEAFRHRVTADAFAAYIRDSSGPASRSSLVDEMCIPCTGGVPPVHGTELAALTTSLSGGWRAVEEHHLEKELTVPALAP